MNLHGFSSHVRHAGGLVIISVLLSSCDPGTPTLGAATGTNTSVAGGVAAPLSDAEYRSLSVDQQYQVVNKLMSTLYKGMSVAEFYDLADGLVVSKEKDPSLTPSELRRRLETDLTDEERKQYDTEIEGDPDAVDATGTSIPIEARFNFDRNKPKQMPLARINTYPLSRNALSQWIALNLANTILFSPAEEIDSADITDVQNLFRRLDLSVMSRRSIREIVATHQRTVENWRRFRSPEDNTREMMEIYLGVFDNDEEVPRASMACRDLYLTDERDGYKLAYTDYPNDEPQLVLEKYVLNCGEFYDAVASHPLLIPRVTSVLVDYFFAGRETADRFAIVEAISASNPHTFEDVYLAILFSRTYLLDTERPKSFEESYLGMAARLKWQPHPDVLMGMTGGRGSVAKADMREMGWPSMSLKLGRITAVPLDSLSFANYHKAMRETLMLDRYRWREPLGLQKPSAPEPAPIEAPPADASSRELASYEANLVEYDQIISDFNQMEKHLYTLELNDYNKKLEPHKLLEDLTFSELLDYLFLSAVERRATDVERQDLKAIIHTNDHLDSEFGGVFVRSGHMDDMAIIVLDYLSRLPEAYYLKKVK